MSQGIRQYQLPAQQERPQFNRKHSSIRGLISSLLFMTITAAATTASACSIPVFRYALENWRPDPYVAFVLHRDDLTAEQQALVDRMQSIQFAGTAAVNLEVRTIQVDSAADDATRLLAEQYGQEELPQLILQKPDQRAPSEVVFSGALTEDHVGHVMESPLRTEISSRLIKGDSVVWVYLECGRAEVDDSRFAMLEKELQRLQNEIELPEIDEDDLDELAGDPESLEIRFSAVRLSRDNMSETVFREMLLHVEPDLRDADYIDEPMAFPVFGRGRALYSLVGDGLSPELVDEACRFLTGACQCTVKAENPGVDLLMQVEWDRFITPTEAVDATLPPLAGFTGFGAEGSSDNPDMTLTADAGEAGGNETGGSSGAAGPENSTEGVVATEQSAGDVPDAAGDNAGLTDTERTEGAVWQNAMFVLVLVGIAVVVTTLLVMRRPAG